MIKNFGPFFFYLWKEFRIKEIYFIILWQNKKDILLFFKLPKSGCINKLWHPGPTIHYDQTLNWHGRQMAPATRDWDIITCLSVRNWERKKRILQPRRNLRPPYSDYSLSIKSAYKSSQPPKEPWFHPIKNDNNL